MAAPMRLFFCRFNNTLIHRYRHVAPSTGAAVNLQSERFNSFFNRYDASQLWDGVAPQGMKRKGRGKRIGKRKRTDLNRGQVIGEGEMNMVWPGLNAPVLKGREIVQQKELPANPERMQQLIKIRESMHKPRVLSLPGLIRGYAGTRWPGMSIGPPDPIMDHKFEGFDTRVLEYKTVSNMTALFGRKMKFSAFVVTGNKNGIAGFAKAKAVNGRSALKQAKNKAAQRLQYIELYDNHTVCHNMYTEERRTRIFIEKKQKGYGLVCQRVLKTICELIGIKDMYAKIEKRGARNIQNLTKAFFKALANQETAQQLAEREKLHVVEYRKEMDNYPVVVASPSGDTRTIQPDEDLDFERIYYEGKVPLARPKKRPPYYKLDSYKKRCFVDYKRRNQYKATVTRRAASEI
ncbi:small ribosomal subunit protein uS5m-like [Tubulanus polymorphus]|uniref:small ribosomal subunit protein uS5m-like n=1 Tax=Tubulanus polymorphus TaxID=672921 RepID=UPI003DA66EE5